MISTRQKIKQFMGVPFREMVRAFSAQIVLHWNLYFLAIRLWLNDFSFVICKMELEITPSTALPLVIGCDSMCVSTKELWSFAFLSVSCGNVCC